MSESTREEAINLECLVAAILTVAVIDQTGTTPLYAVKQYAATLQRLREMGGPVNPMAALL